MTSASILLVSCATLNKEECHSLDWQQLGLQDGQHGYALDRAEKHAKACTKHSITMDYTAYSLGWNNGIKAYCTLKNGYYAGMTGAHYHASCPAEIANHFLTSYRPTLRLYHARQEVAYQERQIEEYLDDLTFYLSSGDPDARDKARRARNDLRMTRANLSLAKEKLQLARGGVRELLNKYPELEKH